MRAGWIGNQALQKRVLRADREARPIVEAVAIDTESAKRTLDDFAGADSSVGLQMLADGGARIGGSIQTHLDHHGDGTTDATDSKITDLDRTEPITMVEVEWGGGAAPEFEIHQLVLRLDAKDTGAAQEVTRWNAQLFRVATDANEDGSDLPVGLVVLEPITGVATAVPGGPSIEDVVFTFTGTMGSHPKVGPPAGRGLGPITVIKVWATKDEGVAAGNVAWLAEPVSSKAFGAHFARAFSYGRLDIATESPRGQTYERLSAVATLGRFELKANSYTQQTIKWTGANKPDLGAVPTNTVEFTVAGEEPSDSTLTGQVRNDADTAWVTFQDGDTTDDLAGVGKNQTYKIQCILDPSGDGNATPTLREIGVREITVTELDGLAVVDSMRSAVDPVTLRGEIDEAIIRLLRDGESDYRDIASQLLATHHAGELQFRVWIGHPDLAKANWLHLHTYLVDDYDSAGPDIVFTCISPLQFTAVTIPPFDNATKERTRKIYTNATLKAAADDLLDTEIELAGRYRGAGIEVTSETVTNTIEKERGKDMLDALAFLAGGAFIASQGRVKFVDMGVRNLDDTESQPRGVVQRYLREDLQPVRLSPGLRTRVDEFFVPYGFWDDGGEKFTGEARAIHGDAVARLGRSFIDFDDVLEDRIAKWIPDLPLAETVAKRQDFRLGTGLLHWRFTTGFPNPAVEPGDVISVETTRFVAADPNFATPREIRGRLWAVGVVTATEGPWADDFEVHVQTYADIDPSSVDVTRINFKRPKVLNASATWDSDGNLSIQIMTEDSGSVKAIADLTAYQGKSTVRAQTEVATDTDGYAEVTSLGVFEPGETAWVSVLSFENADGTGSESAVLFKFEAVRALDLNKVQAVTWTVRGIGDVSGSQAWEVDIHPTFESGVVSYNVQITFIRPRTAADQPPASDTFDFNYDVEVSAGSPHTLENGSSAPQRFLAQDNAGTTIFDGAPSVFVTPYDATGGAGGAGNAGTIWFLGLSS